MVHGGACENDVHQKVWNNNPVKAQATCFLTAVDQRPGVWDPGNNGLPVFVADLSAGLLYVRNCFLSGLWGVGGAWNSNGNFARVRNVLTSDNTHPKPGWYIEANLPMPNDGSHPRVEAECADFPRNSTKFTQFTAPVSNVTKTYTLTQGPGVKACALKEIRGAFNVNSWTDGVVMNLPAKADGNWSATVTGGKSATWECGQ